MLLLHQHADKLPVPAQHILLIFFFNCTWLPIPVEEAAQKGQQCVCRCLSFSTDPSHSDQRHHSARAPSSFSALCADVSGNCHSHSSSQPQRSSTFTGHWPEQEPGPGSSATLPPSSTFSRNPILDWTSEIGISQIFHKHFQMLIKTKKMYLCYNFSLDKEFAFDTKLPTRSLPTVFSSYCQATPKHANGISAKLH